MRILVPLDGSQLAEYALGSAAQLARSLPEEAHIDLVSIVSVTAMAGSYDYPQMVNYQIDAGVKTCNDYLGEVRNRHSLLGLKVDNHVEIGVPAEAICSAAHDLKSDIIFMTSHGRSGLARFALGSVAGEVARKSHVPTMIMRVDESTFAAQINHRPYTILVPLDGSSLAEAILPIVTTIAKAFNGVICLVEVLSSPSGSSDEDRTNLYTAETYLAAVADRLQKLGTVVECSVVWGDPATQIHNKALQPEHECDLIALSTHGRSGFEKLALGSVAESLMSQTPRPILVLNAREH